MGLYRLESSAPYLLVLLLLRLLGGLGVASAQTVSVWLTTDNQSKLLQQQAAVSFSPGSPGTNCVFVDETQTYQQIEGFGAAFTDTTGYTLNQRAQPAARTNALRRSVDFQSAVSQVSNLQGGLADWKSAIQQVGNLRYAKQIPRWHASRP